MADQVLDVFNQDAFSMATLTKTISHIDHMPGLLGDLGLFEAEGVPTTTVYYEEENGTLTLVKSTPRGGPAESNSMDLRKMRSFITRRIALEDSVTADEVQNLRAYATGMTPQRMLATVDAMVQRKLAKLRNRILPTLEYHRIGAVKGVILDADGSTIYDLFSEFGVSQQSHNMLLDTNTTDVNKKVREAVRLALKALGNEMVSSWLAICGDSFFDKFIGHDEVKTFYKNWQAAASYSGEHRAYGRFNFADVDWVNYRGSVGSKDFIESAKAYLIPVGVAGLFASNFAPSDWLDRVNQIPDVSGQPIEARQWIPEGNRMVKIEAQSNPLMICTKPRAIVMLKENT